MAQKAVIGDILEIPTSKGLAFVQFSHFHELPPKYGAVIRVLPGIFKERPKQLQAIANQKQLYYTLFPVQGIVNRKIFKIIGHAEVPSFAKRFPLFRNGVINPQTGKVDEWWLWDGIKEWKIGELTDDQFDLPLQCCWNDALLILRIEQGWTPRKAQAFVQAARLREQVQKKTAVRAIRHFLLFDEKSSAEKARLLVEAAGFKSDINYTSGAGEKVVLLVCQEAPLKEEYVESVAIHLAGIAEKAGGKYDAWETSLSD